MKYHEGDQVLIVGHERQIKEMTKYINTVQTIGKDTQKYQGTIWYDLKEVPYYWREDWLEPAKSIDIEDDCILALFEV